MSNLVPNTKLFIATPCYGGQCFGSYAQGLLNTANLMNSQGIETAFSFLFNESLITRARNSLTHDFPVTICFDAGKAFDGNTMTFKG